MLSTHNAVIVKQLADEAAARVGVLGSMTPSMKKNMKRRRAKTMKATAQAVKVEAARKASDSESNCESEENWDVQTSHTTSVIVSKR